MATRSHHAHAEAAEALRELREAAELAGEQPAFEARLEEVRGRASTPPQQAFWAHWSAIERARLRSAGLAGHASRQGGGARSRPLTPDDFRGWASFSRTTIDTLLAAQPTTVLEALQIPSIGRSTTKRMLAAGLLTDPEGAQLRSPTYEKLRRR